MYTVIVITASLFAVAVLAGLANISGELKEIRNTLREWNRSGGGKLMYDELVKRLQKLSGTDNLSEFDEAADAIEELSKPRWISAEKALPEDDSPVLVTYLGFHDHRPRANMLAYIDRDLGWCWWNDDIPDGTPCSVEITHWMPLPSAPTEE